MRFRRFLSATEKILISSGPSSFQWVNVEARYPLDSDLSG